MSPVWRPPGRGYPARHAPTGGIEDVETRVARLRQVDAIYQGHVQTIASNAYEVERAVLEVCETFLIDHHSMTDEQVARLQHLLGAQGAVAVLMNIGFIDGFTKFRRVFTEGEF